MITLSPNNCSIVIDEKKGIITEFNTHGKNVCLEQGSPLFAVCMRNVMEEFVYWSTEFSFVSNEEKDGKLALKYALAEKGLTVTAFIDPTNDGFVMTLSVDNASELLIDYVDLVPLTVMGKLKEEGGEGSVLYPFNEGLICENLNFRINSSLNYVPPQCPSRLAGGVYPNMVESQFIAYLLDNYGIYMGMHDKTFAPKGIDFYPRDNGMTFELRYFPGLNYGNSLALSCPAIIKVFDGDWMNAGDIYKEWYEQNKPQGLLTLADQKLPEWFEKSPTVVLYPVRGANDKGGMEPNKLFPYMNAMKHIDRLAEQTGGPILAVLMHWEGTAPWNAPYVWPPFGGEQMFKEYVDAVHEKGNYIGVYCSGFSFTEQSKTDWNYNQKDLLTKPEILNSLCRLPNGELAPCQNVTYVRQGYDLCIKGELTKEIMNKEVQSIVDAGIDYVQILDQNHGGNACFCYSDKHGHPVGQGSWQIDAVRDILDDWAKIGGTQTLFGTESTSADPFLKVLNFNDVRYQVNYIGSSHSIPLNNYMFHEYVNNFMGNGCWTGIFFSNTFLFYRAAFSFAQGDMISIIIDENGKMTFGWDTLVTEEKVDEVNFTAMTKQMNAWRRAKKEYLVYGKTQRPETIEFGGLTNSLKHARANRYEVVPQLITSKFLAEDGSTAQFVVNYNEKPIEFKLANGCDMTVFQAPDCAGEKCSSFTVKPFSVVMIK